jgi:hypothetical protein
MAHVVSVGAFAEYVFGLSGRTQRRKSVPAHRAAKFLPLKRGPLRRDRKIVRSSHALGSAAGFAG